MTSALLSRWQPTLGIGLLGLLSALVGGIVAASCRTERHVYPRNTQAFALPGGCPVGSPPSTTTELSACIEGIQFDTTEAIGDEQRLMVIGSGPSSGLPCHGDSTHNCRYGPLAKIEPVKGAEMYSDDALAEGRIIARIYLRQGETESYDKFNLVPVDTTYWWVKTSPNRSSYVHRVAHQAQLDTLSRGLTMTPHPPGTFQQAFAAWVWDETDETMNAGCSGHCCKP